jgi:hypothetical protein
MKTLFFTLAFLGAVTFTVQAQTYTNPNNRNTGGNFQRNELNPSNSIGDGSFNPLDLIHNANFYRGRNSSQFQEDTQEGLNKQAEEFKRRQQEQLQQNNTQP